MIKPSLREYLPDLPYHPDKFAELLPPKKKWLVDWEESFCTNCGTTTPHDAMSHHKECFGYSDKPYEDEVSVYTNPCPECGSSELIMDSSIDLELSQISCMDCDWMVQESICEEDLLDKFNSGYYSKNILK